MATIDTFTHNYHLKSALYLDVDLNKEPNSLIMVVDNPTRESRELVMLPVHTVLGVWVVCCNGRPLTACWTEREAWNMVEVAKREKTTDAYEKTSKELGLGPLQWSVKHITLSTINSLVSAMHKSEYVKAPEGLCHLTTPTQP